MTCYKFLLSIFKIFLDFLTETRPQEHDVPALNV